MVLGGFRSFHVLVTTKALAENGKRGHGKSLAPRVNSLFRIYFKVVVDNLASWNKNYTDFKGKGGLQTV